MPDFSIEDELCPHGIVAGVDEAGRGPLCGPVVAAAVILDKSKIPIGINDSKKVSHKKREALFDDIMISAKVGIGVSSVEEIDEINILEAAKLAMIRAIDNLKTTPNLALIDGNKAPDTKIKCIPVIKGDSKSLSIASASIIAKVTRDRMMLELSREHPQYGWERNAGYGTKEHLEAIKTHGITRHHRKTFKPVSLMLV